MRRGAVQDAVRIVNWKHEDMARMGLVYRTLHLTVPSWHNRLTRMRVKGAEHVPDKGAAILAVLHLSWWDPVIVGAAIERPIHFLGKREVMIGPLTDRFFKSGGIIPVDRDAPSNEEAMRKSIECLESGAVLGVFPEGTRGRIDAPRTPKTGAARLALMTGAPVIPCCALTDRFWPVGRKVPRFGERVYVNFGPPLLFGKDPELEKDRGATIKITNEIFDRILVLRDEAMVARDAREKWPRLIPRAYHYPGAATLKKIFRKKRDT